MITTHRACLVPLLALLLCGCGDGPSTPAVATTSRPDPLQGQVSPAPPGTEVFRLRPTQARTLYALADSVAEVAVPDSDGRFRFHGPAGDSERILVSAPGKALLEVPADSLRGKVLSLEPEASLSLRLTGPEGEPESLALALVLDQRGAPLPLPAAELVSRPDGSVTLGRLPAGNYDCVVESADAVRHASVRVTLAEGERRSLDVSLESDPSAQVRFLSVIGGAADHHPMTHLEEAR